MTESSAPNAATAQARVIADELARGGVRHVLVCPGSRSAALAIAVHDDPRLAVHVHPDERSAAFVALGIGRITGVPAAVVVTSGTAVANLLPAAVEADRAGVPLLLLTADRPPELRATGANQAIEQRGLLDPATRWSHELGVAEDRPDAVRTWRAVVARAVATAAGATGGMPGPVHLNVPTREPTVPVADDGRTVGAPFVNELQGRTSGAPWLRFECDRPGATVDLVDRVVARCVDVERGLIIAGSPLGGSTATAPAIDALVAATGWPVAAEVLAPARAASATLAAGAWLLDDPGFADAAPPDLVVVVGRPTLHGAWWRWLARASDALLVDPYGVVTDPTRVLGDLVVADPTLLLTEVARRLGVRRDAGWGASWRAADSATVAARDEVLEDAALSGLHVARAVAEAVPASSPLVVGSSLPIRDLDLVARSGRSQQVVANRGAAGIDGTVGTALGTALGAGRPVWALLGDVALLHDANGLLLQPEGRWPDATFVVIDNAGGRIFDGLPPARHAPAFERLFAAPPGRDLGLLARLHGFEPILIDDRDGLSVLSDEGSGARRLVVVRVDAAAERALRRELRHRVAEAIAEVAA